MRMQEGFTERSGVPLPTLRKFEQKGAISLESYLKLQIAVGGLDAILNALELSKQRFSSIEEVLEDDNKPSSKEGAENERYYCRKRNQSRHQF